jgi:hypothetical protein
MKARLVGYFSAFLILASAVEGCAVVNTIASLEYETGPKNECVSDLTGQNLCSTLN